MNARDCDLTDQIFSFFGSDGGEFHWNISKILEAVATDKLKPLSCFPLEITEDIYNHVSNNNGIEGYHLVTIDEERLKDPVLFVEFPGGPSPTHVLIDGNHRLVAAYRRGLRKLPTKAFELHQLKPYQVEDFGVLLKGLEC